MSQEPAQSLSMRLLEADRVPDWLIRNRIRALMEQRRQEEDKGDPQSQQEHLMAMVRSLRDEVERYGHYSLAAESMYDKPFQWGSKRNGPDLARVGGKYSDEWHKLHLDNPRGMVTGSIMPAYPWLAKTPVAAQEIAQDMKVLAFQGVPYTPEMIENAAKDLVTQASADAPALAGKPRQQRGAITAPFKPEKLLAQTIGGQPVEDLGQLGIAAAFGLGLAERQPHVAPPQTLTQVAPARG